MINGWIKLHRQLQDSPFYTNSVAVHVWIECLLRATHEEHEVYLKRERVNLMPGQFVMGRDEFGATIGVSGSTAWYWLLQFEADSMIDIRKTSKGSLVSVKKWVDYQQPDNTSDNRKTADEQPMNTYKKVKNDKNVKKVLVNSKSQRTDSDNEQILCRAVEAEGWCDPQYLEKTLNQLRALSKDNRPEAYRKLRVLANSYLSRGEQTTKFAKKLFHEIAGYVNDRGQMEHVLTGEEIARRRAFAQEESGKTYVEEELS